MLSQRIVEPSHLYLQFQVQFKLMALEAGLCLQRWSRYPCVPSSVVLPPALCQNQYLSSCPMTQIRELQPDKSLISCAWPWESCCLHKGGEGNCDWEDDGGRKSLSSMAAFLKLQSLDSVLPLKITQASNKVITSDVTGTSSQKKVVPWEMLFLYRNLFSRYLETPVMFVNLLGPRCHFWPDRLTIEQDIEVFI